MTRYTTLSLLTLPAYNPEPLLDHVKEQLPARRRSDAKLAEALGVSRAEVSRMRHRIRPIPAPVMIAAHELTGTPIKDLRQMIGDTEAKYFPFSARGKTLEERGEA